MSYISPIANPQPFVTKIRGLSDEANTIDSGVGRAKRDAAEFVSKYSADFQIVSELQASTEHFITRWVSTLQQTRDAASSISAWYQRFIEVFLSLIDMIGSEGDVKEVIAEFNNLLGETHPSTKYQLDTTPGVKNAFNEIEALVCVESKHIIDVLQSAKASNFSKTVEGLKKEIAPVKLGAAHIRQALNNYATRLE
ncbi:hypothetical protein SERLA73DRAFT_162848 [Serpula lacrymans var. lacrymans S7.3]|uniref:Uncharacterized protein n=2 Tax=Serpula lacrymans var. lacrymans TaxID=341189 RepID=F8QAH2_SERL3|nr:uncharacterized protein SERLADRAFT_477627 [Serpula lacrymans var. lacrymans S7.9]EGN94762.1 hypothetical protein SERLA73DRAFT_162848 [Serpula lacrymans var. lacrymans S7.3]EGO20239.1 hypothetical protein SERLADRAFT_477627 [Serpula lacrymans var. lacrymans S7.9]